MTVGAECESAKLPKKIRTLVTDIGKVVAYFCNSSDVCIGLGKAIAELRSLALGWAAYLYIP